MSVYAAQVLDPLLFETSRTDVLTLGVVATLMLVVTALACYVPARRSTLLDPIEVLREE